MYHIHVFLFAGSCRNGDEGRNETASYTKPNVNQCKLVCIFIESRKRKKISVAYFYGTRHNLLMCNLFRNI